MPPLRPQAQSVKSASFDPTLFFDAWPEQSVELLPHDNDFRTSIINAFGLKDSDNYVYHATASVTLAQVQQVVNQAGGESGMLHAWYRDPEGKQVMK